MSDRMRVQQTARPAASRIGPAGESWSNPLEKLGKADPGPSSLPPKPQDPSGSQGKRSVSPEKRDQLSHHQRSTPPLPSRPGASTGLYLPPPGSARRPPSPREREPLKRPRHSDHDHPLDRNDGRDRYPGSVSQRGEAYDRGDKWESNQYEEDRGHGHGGGHGGRYRGHDYDRFEPGHRSVRPYDRPYDSAQIPPRPNYHDNEYDDYYGDQRRRYDDDRDRRRHPDNYGREPDRDRDGRHKHSSGESLSYRDRAYNHGQASYRPASPRRRRSRSRSRSRTRSTRRRTPEPEEGEIDEEEGPMPEQGSQPSYQRTATTTAVSSQRSEAGSSYVPPKIKNRPTKRASDISLAADESDPLPPTGNANGNGNGDRNRNRNGSLPPPPPPPPPADGRPPTPPAPPTPPPPSDNPPTPPPPPPLVDVQMDDTPKRIPPTGSADKIQPPHNRALDQTRSQAKYDEYGNRTDGKTSVPHAPNRNLQNPSTRPTTPATKNGTPVKYEAGPKLFRRPTADEELRDLHRTFRGTTTLAAYDLGDKLGEGTFGVVSKGTEISTKRAIALKKLITHNPRDGVSVTTVREIKIIKSLNHPNIVEIIDMVVERKNPSDRSQRGDVFMVFPYMDHDLCGLLSNNAFIISNSINKLLFRQILEGMDFIHANNFIHRDIKTANILVDSEGGVKIADFGLARTWTFDKEMPQHMATEYTNMVVTRWYRAPELLLGETRYGPAVDMWSLGCVLGEMYNRLPILQGETDRDQLFKIFGRLGRPTEDNFPGWRSLPGFPESKGYPWDKVPEDQPLLQVTRKWNMDRGCADLMMQLLRLDPKTRLTANDALDHGWFWCSPSAAVKKPGCITVASSHEMTQRIKNEPPPQAYRPKPQQKMQPRHSGPPPGAGPWGNGGSQLPRHPVPPNGGGGGMGNPYAGLPPPPGPPQAAYNQSNPYATGPPPGRGPPFPNGHGHGGGGGHPPYRQGGNVGMGMGAGLNGLPNRPGSYNARPHMGNHGPPPQQQQQNGPPPTHYSSNTSGYQPPPAPFVLGGGGASRAAPPPPAGFRLGGDRQAYPGPGSGRPPAGPLDLGRPDNAGLNYE